MLLYTSKIERFCGFAEFWYLFPLLVFAFKASSNMCVYTYNTSFFKGRRGSLGCFWWVYNESSHGGTYISSRIRVWSCIYIYTLCRDSTCIHIYIWLCFQIIGPPSRAGTCQYSNMFPQTFAVPINWLWPFLIQLTIFGWGVVGPLSHGYCLPSGTRLTASMEGFQTNTSAKMSILTPEPLGDLEVLTQCSWGSKRKKYYISLRRLPNTWWGGIWAPKTYLKHLLRRYLED